MLLCLLHCSQFLVRYGVRPEVLLLQFTVQSKPESQKLIIHSALIKLAFLFTQYCYCIIYQQQLRQSCKQNSVYNRWVLLNQQEKGTMTILCLHFNKVAMVFFGTMRSIQDWSLYILTLNNNPWAELFSLKGRCDVYVPSHIELTRTCG